jgi:shikimate dehydrogenase
VAAGIVLCGSLSRWAVPLGAAMHEAGYRALGLDWRYVPFEIDEAGVGAAVAGMRALGIRGLGVSMPFKQMVGAHLDAIDDVARRIGAVNTIVNDGGRLTGHNTDWLGAVRALEEARPVVGARVRVLGAGGAARAVAFGLKERGAHVELCNRTDERGAALAAELGVAARPWVERERLEELDVLVNASSAGMATVAPASPIAPGALRGGLVVMDIVYKPLDTELVVAARAAGATAIGGARMLLHQAAAQFELYTGRHTPLEAMDAALGRFLGMGE